MPIEMSGFIDSMTDVLRELYAEDITEIIRNENTDTFCVRTETPTGNPGATLRLQDIFNAINYDNIWNTPVILGLEHGVTFATAYSFSPCSSEIDHQIQFDEEWV